MYFLPYSQNLFCEKLTRTYFGSLVHYFIIQLHRKQLCFLCLLLHPVLSCIQETLGFTHEKPRGWRINRSLLLLWS